MKNQPVKQTKKKSGGTEVQERRRRKEQEWSKLGSLLRCYLDLGPGGGLSPSLFVSILLRKQQQVSVRHGYSWPGLACYYQYTREGMAMRGQAMLVFLVCHPHLDERRVCVPASASEPCAFWWLWCPHCFHVP